MRTNQYGEQIYSEDDLVDFVMQGKDITQYRNMLVEADVDLNAAAELMNLIPNGLYHLIKYREEQHDNVSPEEWDRQCQNNWKMPQEYRDLDIAAYTLGLCQTDAELQRVGQELLLYQERDLFNLLRYLKYLVDVLRANNCIWGVGRGSSVASYVLYLLGVHRIDSIYYELDIAEFLR